MLRACSSIILSTSAISRTETVSNSHGGGIVAKVIVVPAKFVTYVGSPVMPNSKAGLEEGEYLGVCVIGVLISFFSNLYISKSKHGVACSKTRGIVPICYDVQEETLGFV